MQEDSNLDSFVPEPKPSHTTPNLLYSLGTYSFWEKF